MIFKFAKNGFRIEEENKNQERGYLHAGQNRGGFSQDFFLFFFSVNAFLFNFFLLVKFFFRHEKPFGFSAPPKSGAFRAFASSTPKERKSWQEKRLESRKKTRKVEPHNPSPSRWF